MQEGEPRPSRPLEQTTLLPESDAGTNRTSDRGVAPVTKARSCTTQRDCRYPGVDSASGACPQRDEPSSVDGPADRTGGPTDRD